MKKIELLEFKNKFLKMCNTTEIKNVSDILLDVVLNCKITFYDEYLNIIDDSKDWLQALWQYYEADRTEKKQDYTPKGLCRLVSKLSGEVDSVYDCCGGSGALTIEVLKDNPNAEIYVEELDERVIPFLLFNLSLRNVSGYVVNGNVLTKEKFKCFRLNKSERYSNIEMIECPPNIHSFTNAISNPPYNIKWDAPTPFEALADGRFPVIPPSSNANYAFVLNCLKKADKVVMILPNGITSESTEIEVRKYLIENDLIEAVMIMPDKMFEITSISTCILILNRNKENKGEVAFVDNRKNFIIEEREQNGQFGGASHTNRTYTKKFKTLSSDNISKILGVLKSRESIPEFSAFVKNEDVKKNEFVLTPSRYIAFKEKEERHRNLHEIADNINYIQRIQNSCKLVINETIAKNLGLDIDTFKKGTTQSNELADTQKQIGINLVKSDYIQFTKNKNEFVFKCNDKEFLPDMLIQFFHIWKNQIALLNTMQNTYLVELRDALLPDLMSGKINLDGDKGE